MLYLLSHQAAEAPSCSGGLLGSDTLCLSFFGSRFMSKPDSLFENAGLCKCVCTLFWFGLCTGTAKSISVAWPLREHICGEDSTSGSHIFSHHCCSHCKRAERKENKPVKEKEMLLQQRDNKYSFTHHFPLLNQSFLSDLAFHFFYSYRTPCCSCSTLYSFI